MSVQYPNTCICFGCRVKEPCSNDCLQYKSINKKALLRRKNNKKQKPKNMKSKAPIKVRKNPQLGIFEVPIGQLVPQRLSESELEYYQKRADKGDRYADRVLFMHNKAIEKAQSAQQRERPTFKKPDRDLYRSDKGKKTISRLKRKAEENAKFNQVIEDLAKKEGKLNPNFKFPKKKPGNGFSRQRPSQYVHRDDQSACVILNKGEVIASVWADNSQLGYFRANGWTVLTPHENLDYWDQFNTQVREAYLRVARNIREKERALRKKRGLRPLEANYRGNDSLWFRENINKQNAIGRKAVRAAVHRRKQEESDIRAEGFVDWILDTTIGAAQDRMVEYVKRNFTIDAKLVLNYASGLSGIITWLITCYKYQQNQCDGVLLAFVASNCSIQLANAGVNLYYTYEERREHQARGEAGSDKDIVSKEGVVSSVFNWFVNLMSFSNEQLGSDEARQKRISSIASMFKGLKDIITHVGNFLQWIFTSIYELVTGSPYITINQAKIFGSMLECVKEMNEHLENREHTERRIKYAKQFREHIADLDRKFKSERRQLIGKVMKSDENNIYMFGYRIHREWSEAFLPMVERVSRNAVRKAPPCVCLIGPPGVGKSHYGKALRTGMGPSDVYVRNQVSEYWEGYNNQKCVIYDDIFQATDPKVRSVVANELISILSDSPCQLNMANADAKGTKYFDSQCVLLTSNDVSWTRIGINADNALERRVRAYWLQPVAERVYNPSPAHQLLMKKVQWKDDLETNLRTKSLEEMWEVYRMFWDDENKRWVLPDDAEPTSHNDVYDYFHSYHDESIPDEVYQKFFEKRAPNIATQEALAEAGGLWDKIKGRVDESLFNIRRSVLHAAEEHGLSIPENVRANLGDTILLSDDEEETVDNRIIDLEVIEGMTKDIDSMILLRDQFEIDDPQRHELDDQIRIRQTQLSTLKAKMDGQEIEFLVRRTIPKTGTVPLKKRMVARWNQLCGYFKSKETYTEIAEAVNARAHHTSKWVVPTAIAIVSLFVAAIPMIVFRYEAAVPKTPIAVAEYGVGAVPDHTLLRPKAPFIAKGEANQYLHDAKTGIARRVSRIEICDADEVWHSQYVVWVSQSVFVSTGHIFSNEWTCLRFSRLNGDIFGEFYDENEIIISKVPNCDQVFGRIARKNFSPPGVPGERLKFCDSLPDEALVMRVFPDGECHWTTLTHKDMLCYGTHAKAWNYGGDAFDSINVVGYKHQESKPGDCGLPIISVEKGLWRLWALHAASDPEKCYAVQVVESNFNVFNTQAQGKRSRARVQRMATCSTIKLPRVCEAPRVWQVATIQETKFRSSAIRVAMSRFPDKRLPAVLAPRGPLPDQNPFFVSMSKYETDLASKRIPYSFVESYVDHILNAQLPINASPIINEQGSLVEHIDWVLPDLNTSAGFPWGKMGGNKKGDWITPEGKPVPRVKEKIQLLVDLALDKATPSGYEELWFQDVYTAQLKDELLPREKVEAGKTRIFCASPVHTHLLDSFIFTPWMKANRETLYTTGQSAVGLNVHSLQWSLLLHKHHFGFNPEDTKHFCGDISGMDKRMAADMGDYFGHAVAYAYKAKGSWKRLIQARARHFATAHLLAGDTLYRMRGGNVSGSACTAEYNSFCLGLLMTWSYCKAYEKAEIPDDLYNCFRLTVYGDDSILSVKETGIGVAEPFTLDLLAQDLEDYGRLTLTSADKKSDLAWTSNIQELDFLKRRFVWDPFYCHVRAPLSLSNLYDGLRWVQTRNEAMVEWLTIEKCRNAVLECMHLNPLIGWVFYRYVRDLLEQEVGYTQKHLLLSQLRSAYGKDISHYWCIDPEDDWEQYIASADQFLPELRYYTPDDWHVVRVVCNHVYPEMHLGSILHSWAARGYAVGVKTAYYDLFSWKHHDEKQIAGWTGRPIGQDLQDMGDLIDAETAIAREDEDELPPTWKEILLDLEVEDIHCLCKLMLSMPRLEWKSPAGWQ